jgi:capsular exopolysaccharide synthesis family protein
MEIRSYLTPVLKWWWMIFLAVGLAVGTSYYFVRQQPLVYTSHTTLMIGRTISDPNPSGNDFFLNQQLSGLYANMATTEPIQNATKKALGLTFLPKYVVKPLASNQFIEIDVTDTNAERATRVAAEIANQLILVSPGNAQSTDKSHQDFISKQLDDVQQQIVDTQDQITKKQADLSNLQSAKDLAQTQTDLQTLATKLSLLQTNYANLASASKNNVANILQVIEPAMLPTKPVGPSKYLISALAGLIGLVLSVGASYLMESLDDTLKTPTEVQKFLKLPTIGYFMNLGKRFGASPYVYLHPHSQMAEAYRSLRSNIEFSRSENPLHVILVTSLEAKDGKTTVAINLALSLVQTGKQVILVDADLRRPSIHRYLDLPEREGLRDVLEDSTRLDSALYRWKDTDLLILSNGTPTDDLPDRLLSPSQIETFLYDLRRKADVIVIDSSPLIVSDAISLAARADGVLIVVRPGHTNKDLIKNMLDKVERAGANIVGVVLNRIPMHQPGFQGEYRNYSPYNFSNYGSNNHEKGKVQARSKE